MWTDDNKIKTGIWVAVVFNLALIILAGTLIYFLFSVKIPEVKSLYRSIAEGETLEKNTANISQMVEDTKVSRAKLASYFISKESIVGFIEELESLAKQANIVLTMDTPLEEKDTPLSKQASLRLNVKINGRFGDVMYFVRLIEALPYKIFIDHVVLTSFAGPESLSSQTAVKTGWAGAVSFRLDSYIKN